MNYTTLKQEVPVTKADVRQLQNSVQEILSRVQEEGDTAVRFYSQKFDNFAPETFRVTPEEAAIAAEELPKPVVEELDYAIQQVGAFAQAQRDSMTEFEKEIAPGMRMGQRIIPVESAGCYVPAGRYPCLTSAVMSMMPAKIAGVKRIVACSPPGPDGKINQGILYTMWKMGVDEIYCLGGIQAIGAMAYGTKTIAPVDIVVGPGNQYVAEAKRQIFGTVGIDFLAGPSECLVLADETGNAEYIAADLIAQCEHDPHARGCLVTTSETVAQETLVEIERQLKERTTEAVARESWVNKGSVVVVETMAEAADYANEYAPEHLEIHSSNPREVLPLLTNYGSLFIGEKTPEVYADKIAGPNHILPTGAAARYTGGLWVGMFLKVITHMEVDDDASIELAKYTVTQSTYEGMDAHRHAAAIRLRDMVD
ncbi:histidinol dehydrogenase [Candidatus Leptofilum sp.]|uniref:histidinol dehydrogenase n=1 Tax=Candidatus Leptofilum sp. TaxID=3241576 RepID=UPI003B5C2B27